MLAMSLILAALATRVWNSWLNSKPRNSARFSAANIAACWRLLKFCCSNRAKVEASDCAIGSAASIAAWIAACPAIDEADRPRAAIIAAAPRIAPAAQAGVAPPSKSSINPVSCPCTVASLDGAPVAASKLVSFLTRSISTVEPSIISPFSILRGAGALTVCA